MDPGARALIKNGLVKIGASAVEPLVATLRQSESPALPSPVSPGRRLVPELIQALCSTRLLAQQAELIEALREAGAPAATALVGALRAEQDQGRQTILHVALGQMGQVAVPAIVAAIKGADWQFRLRAIDLLGDAGGSEGIESLTRLLGHPELVTRNAAADALARIGPAALEPLLAALKSPDGSVRGAACRGMRGAGKQAVDPLTAALKDKYWSVRKEAAASLRGMSENVPRADWEECLDTLQPLAFLLEKGLYAEVVKQGEKAAKMAEACDGLQGINWAGVRSLLAVAYLGADQYEQAEELFT